MAASNVTSPFQWNDDVSTMSTVDVSNVTLAYDSTSHNVGAITIVIVFALMSVGLIGNFFVCGVFLQKEHRKVSSSFFLVNLAIGM